MEPLADEPEHLVHAVVGLHGVGMLRVVLEQAVAQAFGVPFTPGEKSVKATVNDKEETLIRTLTTRRWTFVIGKDGKILAKNTEVKAADDSKSILEVVAKAGK